MLQGFGQVQALAIKIQPLQTLFNSPDEDLPDDASERGVKHLPAGRRNAISFVCRVASVEEGHLRLSQPLPLGVRAEWNPELHRFLPTLTHAGIEQLTIAFPQARVRPWERFILLFVFQNWAEANTTLSH